MRFTGKWADSVPRLELIEVRTIGFASRLTSPEDTRPAQAPDAIAFIRAIAARWREIAAISVERPASIYLLRKHNGGVN